MTIMLPPEIEAKLKAEAARQGVDATEYAQRLIAKGLPSAPGSQSLGELFAQWEADDHTDDPEELARREQEGEQFMQNLARNRIEMEGPNARNLWP